MRKFLLGLLKELPVPKVMREEMPKARYAVPIPPHPDSPPLLVSFVDKTTMLPVVVKWVIEKEVLRCSLPASQRTELRLAWIEDDHLEGFRCVLGPASKFRTSVEDGRSERVDAEDMM